MTIQPHSVDLMLIYPPWAISGTRGTLQNVLPPLGLLSIASYIEQQGYRVEALDVLAERLDDIGVKSCHA